MQLSEIVSAAPALQKLILQELPLPTAWRLSKLIGLCNPALDFYGIQRVKCRDQSEVEKLMEMDINMDGFEPVTIVMDDSIRLSAADVKTLEPFVQWEVP